MQRYQGGMGWWKNSKLRQNCGQPASGSSVMLLGCERMLCSLSSHTSVAQQIQHLGKALNFSGRQPERWYSLWSIRSNNIRDNL